MYFLASADPTEHVTDKILLKIGDTPVLTMHMVTIVLVTIVFVWAMVQAAKAIATGPESEGNDRYITKGKFGQIIEALVIYLRNEMLVPILGEDQTRRCRALFALPGIALWNSRAERQNRRGTRDGSLLVERRPQTPDRAPFQGLSPAGGARGGDRPRSQGRHTG